MRGRCFYPVTLPVTWFAMAEIAYVWVPFIDLGAERRDVRQDFRSLVTYWDRDSPLIQIDPKAKEPGRGKVPCIGSDGQPSETTVQIIPGRVPNFYRLTTVGAKRRIIGSDNCPSSWNGQVPNDLVAQFMGSRFVYEPVGSGPPVKGFPDIRDPQIEEFLRYSFALAGVFARVESFVGNEPRCGSPVLDAYFPNATVANSKFDDVQRLNLSFAGKLYDAIRSTRNSEDIAIRMQIRWSDHFGEIFPNGGSPSILFEKYHMLPNFVDLRNSELRRDITYGLALAQLNDLKVDLRLSWLNSWYLPRKSKGEQGWLLSDIREKYFPDAEDLDHFEGSNEFKSLVNSTIAGAAYYGFWGYIWKDVVRLIDEFQNLKKCANDNCGSLFVSSDPRTLYCPENPKCQRDRDRLRKRKSRGLKYPYIKGKAEHGRDQGQEEYF